MSPNEKGTLRELAGAFLLEFPALDNSIASLFSSVFGARTNSVEIFYGNLTLQSRIDCIQGFSDQDAFPFGDEERNSIESILASTKQLQRFRNLLAHHFVLDEPILVRGREQPPTKRNPDPEKLYIWKTSKKGKYDVRPVTKKEVKAARDRLLATSVEISILCAHIRLRYGVRP